jgi:hypothetical protein
VLAARLPTGLLDIEGVEENIEDGVKADQGG